LKDSSVGECTEQVAGSVNGHFRANKVSSDPALENLTFAWRTVRGSFPLGESHDERKDARRRPRHNAPEMMVNSAPSFKFQAKAPQKFPQLTKPSNEAIDKNPISAKFTQKSNCRRRSQSLLFESSGWWANDGRF
jgi:hypothetical protein